MRCPKCRTILTRSERDGVPLFTCSGCFGAWLRQAALKRLTRLAPQPGSPEETAELPDLAALVSESNAPRQLPCPECATGMAKDRVHPLVRVQIDRCPKCQGAWLDAGELTLIRKLYRELQTSTDPKVVALRDKLAMAASDAAGRRVELTMWDDDRGDTPLLSMFRALLD